MKKRTAIAISVCILIAITGMIVLFAYRSSEAYRKERAAQTLTAESSETGEGVLREYFRNSDGTWTCEGHTYKYRLEITGRMANAGAELTYVYLSNLEEITFDRAWKASGLSSDLNDYFDAAEAVLVEWRMDNAGRLV